MGIEEIKALRIYVVVEGGRNCLDSSSGFRLKSGDWLHPHPSGNRFMVKFNGGYEKTSMFVSEAIDVEKWDTEGKYRLVDTYSELMTIYPHLTVGGKRSKFRGKDYQFEAYKILKKRHYF